MAKTRDAMKIIDKMIGDDPERRQRIAVARTNAEIAQMVFDARTAAGLTQKQLADLIGTGQSTIARLELRRPFVVVAPTNCEGSGLSNSTKHGPRRLSVPSSVTRSRLHLLIVLGYYFLSTCECFA